MSDSSGFSQASGTPPYNGKPARIYLVVVAVLALAALGYILYFHTPVVEALIDQVAEWIE